MSIKVMTLVWDSKLESSKKFIMLYYADRSSDEGENVWPSVRTVAEKTGLSRRTVQRLTREMINDGLLKEDGQSKYGTNRYVIQLNAIKDYCPRVVVVEEDTDDSPAGPDIADQQGGDTVTPPGYEESQEGCHHNAPVTMTPLDMSPCHPPRVTMTPEPSFNHPINHQLNTCGAVAPRSSDVEKKGDAVDGTLAFLKNGPTLDLSGYPEDVRVILTEVYTLWKLVPPVDRTKALWIREARELQAACGEFGLALLHRYFDKWKAVPGKDRLTIARPGSLTKLIGAEAGLARQERDERNNPLVGYDPARVAAFQAGLKKIREQQNANT